MSDKPFDVNDRKRRDDFLRHEISTALTGLTASARPQWGRMSAQQMVEHLIWALEISTGKIEVACTTSEADQKRIRGFLYENRPMPRDYMNPALATGLPPLQHATLDAAKAALLRELAYFLGQAQVTETLHTHPVLGPIDHEDWHRIHYKHTHHHFEQFGLIASA